MAKLSFATKLEVHPPKVDLKGKTDKEKAAIKKAIVGGTVKAVSYVQRDLKVALERALESSTWAWPRNTIRTNGQTAGTVRNIVDTGKLKSSQKLTEKHLQSKSTIEISYMAPYAGIVHYGGVVQPYGNRNANTVIIPARPWIEATLKGTHGIAKFDMKKPMNDGFMEVWKKQFG